MIELGSGSNEDQPKARRFCFKRINIAKNPNVPDTTTTIETTCVYNAGFLAGKNVSWDGYHMIDDNAEENGVGVGEGDGERQ